MLSLTRVFTAAALCAAALSAQPAPGPDVIGLTDTTPLLLRQELQNCATRSCMPPLGSAANALAGGTAHDPRDRGTWVTDGLRLAKVDIRRQCLVICRPIPVPNLASGEVATGLACNEITGRLFISYSNNVIHTYDVAGSCGLTLVSRCIAPVPRDHVVAGLATDDPNRTIYVASTPRRIGAATAPVVYSALQATPCTPICRYRIPDCGTSFLRTITGLGFDPCRRVLYVTDGPTVVGAAIAPNCQVRRVACCRLNINETYVGLCVLPTDERSSGRSCQGGTCPSCPTMRHVLGGDPTIGNPAFALDLDAAPANSTAFLVVNAGACLPTGPTFGFCGEILVPLAPVILGPVPTGGAATCDGSARTTLAIPPAPALCGVRLSSQYIGLCRAPTGIGTYVSNCLTWTISGS